MNASFFQELLSSIAERGRALLGPGRFGEARMAHGPLLELCDDLVSSRGEASGVAIAEEILECYTLLPADERLAFLKALATDFGPDEKKLTEAARAFVETPTREGGHRLHIAAEPRRQELIRRLNLAFGGTAALVAMRQDVIAALPEHPEVELLDDDFRHLLGSWFNRGFLVMRRISWSTPASVLAKIIEYEAVHEIQDWNDLRRRLEPEDRRCFGFFHPALVDEPLIFVEVALTRDIVGSIGDLLAEERDILPVREARTAMFYSISNCQKGLRGISFGNFLIKQVVEELAQELPQIETFVTLSPVPGLRAWIEREKAANPSVVTAADREALKALDEPAWHRDAEKAEAVRKALTPLAAHYFLRAKSRDARPPDPVARFHLGNGARLERINWLGDVSTKGLAQAGGLMVNYRYVLAEIERNHEAFVNAGDVAASPQVRRLLRPETQTRALVAADD